MNLVAGQKIRILEGASVLPGGYLHGWITTTHSYCGSLPPAMVAVMSGTGGDESTESETMPMTRVSADFVAYPNPSHGPFTIAGADHLPLQPARITITDLRGSVVADVMHKDGDRQYIDLSGRPAGLYLIRLTGETGTAILKIVIRP